MPSAVELHWAGEGRLEVAGVPFLILDGYGAAVEPTTGTLHLRKTRALIEAVVAVVDEIEPRRIFELGICNGGSVAFLELVASPERHVAVDIASGAPMLDAWLEQHDNTHAVRTYYGLDQADAAALHEIVARDFGGEPIDLVIDDASHRFDETRVSFNTLFPYVREGGLYVIEDWSWVHLLESTILATLEGQSVDLPLTNPAEVAAPSPARLLIELLIGCVDLRGAIEEIRVTRGFAIVTRGRATLDPHTFDVASLYGPAGQALTGPPQTN